MNKYIAFDLELEQPNTNKDTPDSHLSEAKIIQAGFVVFKVEPEFVCIHEYLEHVNMRFPLSEHIKILTGIKDEDIAGGTNLRTVYNDIVQTSKNFDTDRCLIQWGGDDDTVFREQLGLHRDSEEWIFGDSGLNVKHLFSRVYARAKGIREYGGLSNCMERCGIPFKGRKHNALNDAYNTARFFSFLYHGYKAG